jgi:hypothetical protein
MTTQSLESTRDDRLLNVSLWIAQALLAIVFTLGGLARLLLPLYDLSEHLGWATEGNLLWVRWQGVAMLVIALGLMFPRPIRRLVPGTAVIVALIMVVLTASHIIKSQAGLLVLDAWLAGLAVFVAWGRSKRLPF